MRATQNVLLAVANPADMYVRTALLVYSNPCKSLERSWGFQEVETPRFQDNRHTKMVRLSAILAGRL